MSRSHEYIESGRYPRRASHKRQGCGCFAVFAAIAVIVVVLVAAVLFARPLLSQVPGYRAAEELVTGAVGQGRVLPQRNDEAVDRALADCYVYSRLSDSDRQRYRIMYDALVSRESRDYPYSGADDLARIRDYVIADHPEMFYVNGVNAHTTNIASLFGTESVSSIEGIYRYSEQEAEALQRQLDEAAAVCLAGVPRDADDYAKAKYLYEYLVEGVEYDWAAYDDAASESQGGLGQTAVDALVGKAAVCAGYSNAFGYLAQKLGLQTIYVTGTARGDSHAWNAVRLDGDFYYVDVTWGDPQFVSEAGEKTSSGRVNYDYLCVTTADILREHEFDANAVVPDCTAMEDNYYVREGALLDSADIDQAGRVIESAWRQGRSSAQVRCTTYGVYAKLKGSLFDAGGIYDYLPGDSCWYTSNDELCSITVIF